MGTLVNRQRAGALGAALIVVVAVMLLFPSIIERAFGNPPPPPPDPACATIVSPHFYTNDVPGTNFFGPPAAGTTLEQLRTELHDRRCQDPALVVGHAYDAGLEGFAQLSGEQAFTAKIVELIENRDLWRQTVAILEDGENQASAEVTTMEGSYQTLYMVAGVVPQIHQAEVDRPSFAVLKFTLPDGSERIYKLDCGFQPVRQGKFPGVPKLPHPPGQPPEGGPECVVNCVPPCVGICHDKDPSKSVQNNPLVPDQVKGPGCPYQATPGGPCQPARAPDTYVPPDQLPPNGIIPGTKDPPPVLPSPAKDPATANPTPATPGPTPTNPVPITQPSNW